MRKNEEKLKDILEAIVGRRKFRENFDRVAIETIWKREMGPMINKYTGKFNFQRGLLTVEISSAPLRQELSGSREKLRLIINDEVGREVVKEIRVY